MVKLKPDPIATILRNFWKGKKVKSKNFRSQGKAQSQTTNGPILQFTMFVDKYIYSPSQSWISQPIIADFLIFQKSRQFILFESLLYRVEGKKGKFLIMNMWLCGALLAMRLIHQWLWSLQNHTSHKKEANSSISKQSRSNGFLYSFSCYHFPGNKTKNQLSYCFLTID